MKVIKNGYIKEVECKCCKSIIEYNSQEEIQHKEILRRGIQYTKQENYNVPWDVQYIICPVCGKVIEIDAYII